MTQDGRPPVEVLKVSASSKPVAVAGAIAGVIRTQGRVEVQAIGAGAINQAVKAIAISRGYVAPGGIELVCVPSFIDISIDGEERTGIRLLVEVRGRRGRVKWPERCHDPHGGGASTSGPSGAR
jgi:stage V sporulation protein S